MLKDSKQVPTKFQIAIIDFSCRSLILGPALGISQSRLGRRTIGFHPMQDWPLQLASCESYLDIARILLAQRSFYLMHTLETFHFG
jgi:hypothetical protein